MQDFRKWTMVGQALAALTPTATIGGAAQAATTVVSLPYESGIARHLFVPRANNINVPKGQFGLVLWQVNPYQPGGLLVPTTWDAGSQTGFRPSSPGSAQLGFRNQAGTSTAQWEGDTVGAYLNSADLRGSSGNQKMMITPQYRFPAGSQPVVFASSNGWLHMGLDLQVPVAAGSEAYANMDFEFIDPNGARISYTVSLFHNQARRPVMETGFDGPTQSYMLRSPLGLDSRFVSAAAGSASETGTPWGGWRHFEWTISDAQFAAGLKYLAAQYPGAAISQNPAHYMLSAMHMNAEIHFTTTQTELGWSMRAASLSFSG